MQFKFNVTLFIALFLILPQFIRAEAIVTKIEPIIVIGEKVELSAGRFRRKG